jgi:hypothetical protein
MADQGESYITKFFGYIDCRRLLTTSLSFSSNVAYLLSWDSVAFENATNQALKPHRAPGGDKRRALFKKSG